MTHQQKLSAIHEEISKVVEDIKDLRNGCRVYWKCRDVTIMATIIEKNYAGNYLVTNGIGRSTINKKKITGIIGRPITLADVIFCLKEFAKKYKLMTGRLFGLEPILLKLLEIWNLAKTLDEQDEAVVSFLYQILK